MQFYQYSNCIRNKIGKISVENLNKKKTTIRLLMPSNEKQTKSMTHTNFFFIC